MRKQMAVKVLAEVLDSRRKNRQVAHSQMTITEAIECAYDYLALKCELDTIKEDLRKPYTWKKNRKIEA